MSFLQAVISSFSHLEQEDLGGRGMWPESERPLLSLGGKGTDGQISKSCLIWSLFKPPIQEQKVCVRRSLEESLLQDEVAKPSKTLIITP